MAELPAAMLQEGRHEDPHFPPDEELYRRVPPNLWDDDDVNLDAIQLPDMSVNRSQYSRPAWVRWVRSEGQNEYLPDWGVIGFRVEDIPPELEHLGVFRYVFRPEHKPLKYNYPHAEVRAYERGEGFDPPGEHIGRRLMGRITPDIHLRWREQLRRRCRIVLRPDEEEP